MRKYLISLTVFLLVFSCLIPQAAALPIGVYHNHENDANMIALTFDDGPHPKYTMEILEILDEYDIPATFFFVGENVSYYQETACEVAKRGHEIGNHTYSHPCVNKQSQAAFREELTRCEDIIQRVVGVRPKLFRPPQGSWNTRVYEIARERDYSVILWDLDTLDWAHTPSENISNYILENVKSGNIILMHDYHSGGCTTTDALRMFIPNLIEQGYQFVTVSELIGS
ncbi:MAG: polysaccharide deacetylase family protein [Clostridia bacterium]|nr:polysaccharide deacetylase family protein [Clostridia bacterium]